MVKKISITKKALIPECPRVPLSNRSNFPLLFFLYFLSGFSMLILDCSFSLDLEKYLLIFRISVLILNSCGRIFPLLGEILISQKFSIRNKHIMIDLGIDNNKINWALKDKQEFRDIIGTVYCEAWKGRGLVIVPKDYSTKYCY
ncbi:hypothetical protein CXB51_014984 [Gossypium anomalum]|uniref:Uncharacterized protein n=1 Tax=Gossypium anomalum TaxID=47600 RepID=A0A8J5ZLX3_9ROSI|nr:hypothetical protein CXB51_014984 [Gossypium anomalum]